MALLAQAAPPVGRFLVIMILFTLLVGPGSLYVARKRGPLFVLTDNRTYSAAEMFAAVLQNNGAAKIIGARTGGDGCGFMNDPAPVSLAHAGLRFRVPNCVRMRADGTDEVAGVIPDLPVLPTAGESTRAQALRVIDTVRGSLETP